MSIEIKLPVLGEGIDSATVTNVLVAVGDKITAEQAVLEVDTEKASVDVPTSAAGTVQEIRVKQGDVVKVGQVLLALSDGVSAKASTPVPLKAEESRKASPAPPPPPAPEPMPAPAAPEKIEKPAAQEKAADREPSREAALTSPKLRRMARELGVDIDTVAGSGADGRVTEDDVRNHARSIILNASNQNGAGVHASSLPDFSKWGGIERKPMSSVRLKTAEHVQEAWSIPHVTYFDSADITDLDRLRTTLAGRAEKAGGKLTVTAIAIKVVASALKVFPQFNVSVDLSHREIIFKKYCHIGVAVDTPKGLLVPVIRDVDQKNIVTLSKELSLLADKARSGKLGIDEMQGGSFTITNLGGIGGSGFTPIINSPEVAILGLSRGSQQAVFRNDQFEPRLMLPLALSFDHRAIDGADAARFLRWITEALEQPFLLAFEG